MNRRTINASIVAALNELHADGQITRQQIEEAADSSKSTVSRWFNGETTPDIVDVLMVIGDRNLPIEFRRRFGDQLLARTGFVLHCTTGDCGDAADSLERALGCLNTSSELVREVHSALSDRVVTRDEETRVKSILTSLRTRCDQLEADINSKVGR